MLGATGMLYSQFPGSDLMLRRRGGLSGPVPGGGAWYGGASVTVASAQAATPSTTKHSAATFLSLSCTIVQGEQWENALSADVNNLTLAARSTSGCSNVYLPPLARTSRSGQWLVKVVKYFVKTCILLTPR